MPCRPGMTRSVWVPLRAARDALAPTRVDLNTPRTALPVVERPMRTPRVRVVKQPLSTPPSMRRLRRVPPSRRSRRAEDGRIGRSSDQGEHASRPPSRDAVGVERGPFITSGAPRGCAGSRAAARLTHGSSQDVSARSVASRRRACGWWRARRRREPRNYRLRARHTVRAQRETKKTGIASRLLRWRKARHQLARGLAARVCARRCAQPRRPRR